MEYNLDENSDCEGYSNEDEGDNESIVLDSDPNSSDIEVSSVGSSEGQWSLFTWNFDVSVATALNYFNLLFIPEIFSAIRDHTNYYAIFK